MSSRYNLQYYHSFQGGGSFMGCYCCGLRDGGVLVVLAVKDGVEYVIQQNGKQRVMHIPIEGRESPFSLTSRKEQVLLYWHFRILHRRL